MKPIEMSGLNSVNYFDIESSHVGSPYRIFVASPEMMAPGETYPVIYVLDANGMFASTMEVQRALALGGEIPQAFVVGIGYPVDGGFLETLPMRFRDLTPSEGGPVEAAVLTGSITSVDVKLGGMQKFFSFVSDELIPEIEKTYPVKIDDRCIAGASLGGLFSCWTLLHHPECFQKYICVSPSIWWDGEAVWNWIESNSSALCKVEGAAFISSGGLETAAETKVNLECLVETMGDAGQAIVPTFDVFENYGWPKMAEITPIFSEKLRTFCKGLMINDYIFPDETHISVVPAAVSRGLRSVFGNLKAASEE